MKKIYLKKLVIHSFTKGTGWNLSVFHGFILHPICEYTVTHI